MIKANTISEIELTLNLPRLFYYDYGDEEIYNEIEYIGEQISMLGLYLAYLEGKGIKYKVDSRPNNKFYINICFRHLNNGNDYPVTIIERKGIFVCRGCNSGGHIIDFIGEVYKLSPDEISKILFSYIDGTYNELSDTEKKIYDQLFYKYDLKDRYISISEQKKQNLDNRIRRYIMQHKVIDYSRIARHLGCSEQYVQSFIKTENQSMYGISPKRTSLEEFDTFRELISTPVNDSEYNQLLRMIEEIYNTSFENQKWIEIILEFLNNSETEKRYNVYHLPPDLNSGTRRCAYRLISTEEDMPYLITDFDVQALKKLKAQTPFILYDYEEESTNDTDAYLNQPRTLRKVLESIGLFSELSKITDISREVLESTSMFRELMEHLCEYCFYQVKQEKKSRKNKHVRRRMPVSPE